MSDKFHVNLREARKSTGMTQKEVAEKVGVARSTYALYETGERSPDVEVVKKLAEALNVTGDYLIGNRHVETRMYPTFFDEMQRRYGTKKLLAYMEALSKLHEEDE